MAQGTIQQVANISGYDVTTGENYCKMPGGVMLAWGEAGAYHSGNSNDITVNLGFPFANAYYEVIASGYYASDSGNYEVIATTKVKSASEFEIHLKNPTSNYTNKVRWIAIGYWK